MHNRKRPPSYEHGCALSIFHWARCHLPQARSQFKSRSTANHVSILVPVPSDADSPKFKTTTGSTKWIPEKNVVQWNIKSFPVSVNTKSMIQFSFVRFHYAPPPAHRSCGRIMWSGSPSSVWQKASLGWTKSMFVVQCQGHFDVLNTCLVLT